MKRNKVIVFTGGGSGGHLTPLMSVAQILRTEAPEFKLVYIGQKGDNLGDIISDNPLFHSVYTVRAGKFRRYNGEGYKQIFDVKTMLLNFRDMFYVAIGLFQSWRLLGKLNPSVVFCKGGFVCVPVGLASALRRIPYVTHDSDALPGLANRIIARWAAHHAVSLPKELYSYPPEKTITTGVPIQAGFKHVTEHMTISARDKLKIIKSANAVLVIGGGLGATRVNDAVLDVARKMFADIPKLYILHVAGRNSLDAVTDAYKSKLTDDQFKRVQVYGFTNDVVTLGEAATVVITRAGATNLAEFATQAKPCIIIPNNQLTGGHQTKNAMAYHRQGAAIVLPETELKQLARVTTDLINSKHLQQQLSEKIATFATKDAAGSIAHLLLATSLKSSL